MSEPSVYSMCDPRGFGTASFLRTFEGSENIVPDELIEAGHRFREDDRLVVEPYVDGELGPAIRVGARHPANDLAVLNLAKVGFKAERFVLGIVRVGGGARKVTCKHNRRRSVVLILIPKVME